MLHNASKTAISVVIGDQFWVKFHIIIDSKRSVLFFQDDQGNNKEINIYQGSALSLTISWYLLVDFRFFKMKSRPTGLA